MAKYYVDAGHTLKGLGCGAIGILNESTVVRNIAKYLIEYLESEGHTVKLGQIESESKKGDNYVKEVSEANKWGADYFISLHCNASNGSGRGAEVFTYSKPDSKAVGVQKKLVSLGFKNRGNKTSTSLYVLKHTHMKAMLIECFFIDNEEDVARYNRIGAKGMAKAIAEGFLGKAISEEQPKPTEEGVYRVVCGSFREKENAQVLQEDLASKGFASFLVYEK